MLELTVRVVGMLRLPLSRNTSDPRQDFVSLFDNGEYCDTTEREDSPQQAYDNPASEEFAAEYIGRTVKTVDMSASTLRSFDMLCFSSMDTPKHAVPGG